MTTFQAEHDEGLTQSNDVGWIWTVLTKKELDLVMCGDKEGERSMMPSEFLGG